MVLRREIIAKGQQCPAVPNQAMPGLRVLDKIKLRIRDMQNGADLLPIRIRLVQHLDQVTVIDDRTGFPIRKHVFRILGDTGWHTAELPRLLVNKHQMPCTGFRLGEQVKLINKNPGADLSLLVRYSPIPDIL